MIGRYDVYAELGTGGMASVFLALDLALDRKVAIKVMSPALANSPDNIERFKREAKVAASLNHPHIIGILAVGDDPDLAYFVMKYIEGRSLDSVIKDEGPQSVPFTQSVIASAGKALHHAHTRGIIHRDVKPANFMLDKDGWLVVTDFGIAKQGEAKGLTMTGSIVGTPYYMSPEQFHGKPVTAAADQYALGVVAHELLTGKQPYTGETIAEVMRGHLFDEIPRVRTLRPDVPQEVDDCIARMMAKDPAERFATLEDAVNAFGTVAPNVEAEVRTQIIKLAELGALQQPRMDVPLSPIPAQRPSQRTSVAPSAPARPMRPRPVVSPEPAPSRVPTVLLTLVVVLVGAAAGVWFTPSLRETVLAKAGLVATAPVTTPAPEPVVVPPVVDSAGLADSIRAVLAKELGDSIAREDSVRRAAADAANREREARRVALARARTDSIRIDSIARASAAASAAANRPTTSGEAKPPRTATQPPAATPTPVVPLGPGTVRIGSRMEGTVLYVNTEPRPIGGLGVQSLALPAGDVRLQIRREGCATWDTTFTVTAEQTHVIGYRAPRC